MSQLCKTPEGPLAAIDSCPFAPILSVDDALRCTGVLARDLIDNLPFTVCSPMTTRRRAREIVLQLLYEEDLHPEQNAAVADQFLTKRLHGNRPLVEFARKLFQNVVANRKELDKALSSKAANWSLRRMAAIDRNVLRLGAYEILMTDTPGRVVINEAVELAKRYGDRQSGQFVNGILDRVLHQTANSSAESDPPQDNSIPAETAADPVAENQIANRQASDESTSTSPAINQPARSDVPPPKVNYGRFQTT